MAIVSECTGHTRHSQHHVLWYFFHQPTTTVSLEFTYELDIIEKACCSRSRGGGEFNRPVKVDSVHVARAVINRIAPQGSHRYSRRGPQGKHALATIKSALWTTKWLRFYVSLAHTGIFSTITKLIKSRKT